LYSYAGIINYLSQSHFSTITQTFPMFRLQHTPASKLFFTTCITIILCLHVQSQKPNIVYIMTDDMGYADLSCYGRKDYTTPNLDKLASQGMMFTNAYSAAPLCTPARTAFMTGRYPARTPVGLIEPLTSGKADSAYGLTTEYPSVATLLRSGGYETALVGKWHLGILSRNSPNKNGFDYFFGIHSGAADYISHKGDGGRHDLYENEQPVYPKGYMTDLFAEKAIAFLNQEHKKPFFLSVDFTAPHWPWQGPDSKPYDTVNFRSGGSPAIFAQMMKSLDDAVGRIMKTLDNEQLKNTIVIFTNDNGGEQFSNHGGLAGSKSFLWEGGIKVPAFVRWPGKIKAGSNTGQLAVTMDWTATILAAAGIHAHKDFPLDGIDLMPVLTNKSKTVTRTLYWRSFQRHKEKAVREGDWKYLKDEKGEYLFNIAVDAGEKNNLKDANKNVFDKLKRQMTAWEKTVLEPIAL
jgi:arylsulfatase A-like enzyme